MRPARSTKRWSSSERSMQINAALELALALGRRNELALARIALVRAAEALGDARLRDEELAALAGLAPEEVSFEARAALADLRASSRPKPQTA